MDLEQRASSVCAPLTLRAGIATGHALLFEGDDYIGSAVNMAARLCDYAHDFDVLMPTMHLDRLPEGVMPSPFGEIELRGFPGAIDVVAPDRRADVGQPPRHRRTLDPQPVRLTATPEAARAGSASGRGRWRRWRPCPC